MANIKRFLTSLGLVRIERKLTNEQIEYLHQCKFIYFVFILLNIHLSLDYAINNYPEDAELEEIAKQWNNNDLDVSKVFYVSSVFICLVYL